VFNDLFFRLRSLLRRDTVDSEADVELRFHFDQQVEKFLKSGLTRQAASILRSGKASALGRCCVS
jgi:hypothetical protein